MKPQIFAPAEIVKPKKVGFLARASQVIWRILTRGSDLPEADKIW
jgi:hypothetical protein